MRVVTSVAEMKLVSQEVRNSGKRIGFVPTMGALHEGHLALVAEARKHAETIVLSIFVNPTQFGDPQDFQKYPKDFDGDLKKCQQAHVDILFCPSKDDIYPENEVLEKITLPSVAYPLEGSSRPGHFEGVLTIVQKLFRIIAPHVAIFGLKDYQQLRVIEDFFKSKKSHVQIIGYPIVRTPEGLAMSSRNQRLSPIGLQKALRISKTLQLAEQLVQSKSRKTAELKEKLTQFLAAEPEITIDYIAIVDFQTLEDLPVNSTLPPKFLVAIAAFVEGVRLIDNKEISCAS